MSDDNEIEFNMDEALALAYDAAVAEPETTETVEATDAPTQAEQRARDDAGRFARKEGEAEVAQVTTEQPKAKRPRPAMLPQELPWDELPETWQEYHERRERETAKGFEERARRLKAVEPIEQAIEPYRAKLKAVYGSEAQALQQLLNLSDFAERDPQGFMQHFAQHRGLAPLQLAEHATQQQFDPQTAVRQAMQEAEAEKAFQTFAAQRGEDPYFNEQQYSPDGTPIYPFRQLMAGLLSAGVAQDFDQAYQMAQWARPDIREKQIADQLAKARSEWEAEAKKRAEEAQRANSANVRSGPSPRLPAKGKTIEETLASVYDSMRAA